MEIENTDEKVLLQQMILGHQAAWEHIANSYFPILYSYVMRLVQEEMVAEEIVQDVFVNIWAKRHEIEIRISLKAYLFRAARNQSLNYIKRRKFEGNYQRNLAEHFDYATFDTENTVHFEELQKALTEAINNLPDSCREIFKLSRFEELTYKEISEALDLPVRTVHYQIGLALKSLKQSLGKQYDLGNMPLWWLLILSWTLFA